MSTRAVAGDDLTIAFTLYNVDVITGVKTPVVVDPGAIVTGIITTPDYKTAKSQEVAILEGGHTDNNWATGVVVLVMPDSVSALITDYGRSAVQITVDDGGKTTYLFDAVEVVQKHTS